MSANIFWRRLDSGKTDIPAGAPSSVIEALERADLYGRRLDDGDAAKLAGVAAGLSQRDAARALDDLVDKLFEGFVVEIGADY